MSDAPLIAEPALDLLRMVRVLHERGYQRIRIVPGMSPSGTAWRCEITTAAGTRRSHGARNAFTGPSVRYSSGSERRYFTWDDAETATPEGLADRFIERFSRICEAGRGRDPDYVKWFAEMLPALEAAKAVPIAYADHEVPDEYLTTVGGATIQIPLPPPGEHDDAP